MGLNLIYGTGGKCLNPVRTANTIMSYFDRKIYTFISINLNNDVVINIFITIISYFLGLFEIVHISAHNLL